MLNTRFQRGFSFIESMLAVFLVSVGLLVALKLLTAGLKNSMDARNQFTASLLAQEGVELVRNVRDNNWVDNNPVTGSFNGLNESTQNNTNCAIDYNTSLNCSSPDNTLNLNSNYYDHNGGSATKYKRRILLNYDTTPNPNYLVVTSMVTWGTNSFPIYSNVSTQCNTSNKCAYTQITLNKWGE